MRAIILTVSDRSAQGRREDASGPALAQRLHLAGWEVVESALVPDDAEQISQRLRQWADEDAADIILTTGGTGFAPRDVTPEATAAVIERPAPGLAEAMRLESLKITPHAMLSRAMAGIRKRCLVINLPGSPKAALENLNILLPVLPHAVELLRDDAHAESGHGSV